ncbi:MAG: RNA polymerase factor sigma-54 [Bacteroidales bacterium]|nr:RNA polymerase factor sigma-54 [Bacteroidales bacterium]
MGSLKQTTELRQQQKFSPQQILTTKLIELPSVDLESRILKEIEENPVLEEDKQKEEVEGQPKEVSLSTIKDDDNIPYYKTYVNNQGKDPIQHTFNFSVKQSFSGSLLEQLGFRHLSEKEYEIARFIIGSLDSDGYLRRETEKLVDDLALKFGIDATEDEVLDMIDLIQSFEPVGVGARNLRECLLIQLKRAKQDQLTIDTARVISDYFEEFTRKHYDKLLSKTGFSVDYLKQIQSRILKLTPSPGGTIDDSYSDQALQIVPDFILDINEQAGTVEMTMPRYNIPELRINRRYAEMLMEAQGASEKQKKEAELFVKKKIESAKGFIEAIRQRYETLSKTMNAIIEFQKDYFIAGCDDLKLKPMILEDIANATGFDISTISRVVNSKYLEAGREIISLKHFFSEAMVNAAGEEVSTRQIKKILAEKVAAEDKRKPLTDEELVDVLKAEGYNIARRTVAKYRDMLSIPTARLRKELL